jgi:copper chaperone CopZ
MGGSRLDLALVETLIERRRRFLMAKSTPLQFKVPDMDCQSCISSIEQAVHRIDADASVAADLETKRVVIGSEKAEIHEMMAAIEAAGFEVEAA